MSFFDILRLLIAFICNIMFFSALTKASVIPENAGEFVIDYNVTCSLGEQPSGCVYDYIFNAFPSEGYGFSHWEIDGLVISQNPYIIHSLIP